MKTPLEAQEELAVYSQEAYDAYMAPINELINKSDSEKLEELQRLLSKES